MARSRSLPDWSRRDFLRFSAAGASFASLSGWLDVLAARALAAGTGGKHKSCILLWMEGGASHKDTFDLKPGTADGGDFKPIATSVPGIEISEHLPKVARQMHHAALLRGMSTNQGAHGPARYFMHTGYREGSGGLIHPSLGSIVSSELGRARLPAAELRLGRRQERLWRGLPGREASTPGRGRRRKGGREPQPDGRHAPIREAVRPAR